MNSVLILAGGKSERMRFPKPYLSLNGKTFLQTIIDEYYKAGLKNICLVLNKNFHSKEWVNFFSGLDSRVNIVENPYPELGRFYSIKLGIKNLIGSENCFIQNIDNPFITKKAILDLLNSRSQEGYVSPAFNGKSGHPVLISKSIIECINEITDENHKLSDILAQFPQRKVECSEEVLININTPEEFEFYANTNLVQ